MSLIPQHNRKAETLQIQNTELLLKCEKLEHELATLRAKAEAYDNGQTTNGVFSETTGKIVCVISTPTKDLAPGYTCRKVRVCEVVG